MKYLLHITVTILIFTSCESLLIKDLEIDETGFEKQVVLQSFIEAGNDSIVVLISENESVLTSEQDIKYLQGVDARLFHDGVELAQLAQGDDGLYYHYFNEPLNERGVYEIIVKDTPYGDALAKTSLPADRQIRNIKYAASVGTDPLEMTDVSEISFVIDDPIGKDYYTVRVNDIIGVIDTFIGGSGDTILRENEIYVYPSSTQLDPSISTTGFDGDIVINDDTFDGQSKEIKIRFQFSLWTSFEDVAEKYRKYVTFNFTTHSEESFNYVTSINAYDQARDFAIFSEPVSVYTNVENGLGVFGGRSTKTYKVD